MQQFLLDTMPEQRPIGSKLDVGRQRKCRLERIGQPIPDMTDRVTKSSQPDGHIGNRYGWLSTGFVGDYHVDFRHQQHAIEYGEHEQPATKIRQLREAGEHGHRHRDYTNQRERSQQPEKIGAADDCGHSVEYKLQLHDVPVGKYLECHPDQPGDVYLLPNTDIELNAWAGMPAISVWCINCICLCKSAAVVDFVYSAVRSASASDATARRESIRL
ncbi:MAG: hypothetical protein ACD_23C00405G0004 [uncultured bacterium]|nr:MAG: hypothetical protein ACD_23C00405G0004 [uncultured bacterium]